MTWIRLLSGLYLIYLPYQHVFQHQHGAAARRTPPKAVPWIGMTAFWATVVKVELTDILTGGILGIITMRMVIGQLLGLVRRFPALVDGAFIIIAWVAIKLVVEYGHALGYIHFEVPSGSRLV